MRFVHKCEDCSIYIDISEQAAVMDFRGCVDEPCSACSEAVSKVGDFLTDAGLSKGQMIDLAEKISAVANEELGE